ncbi:6-phospho-beta-glucosidase, partial [Mesorhizobium sp. M00.F.Ca.ET.186.01.1.1]
LDGNNVTPQIIDKLTGEQSGITMQNILDLGWDKDFIKALGILPCPYHRYYYQTRTMLEHEQEEASKNGTRAEVVKQVEAELFALYEDPDLNIKPP